jgi:hypothetical protein
VRKVSGFLLSAFIVLAIVVIAPIADAKDGRRAPLALTLLPTSVTATSVQLHGAVMAGNDTTTYWFQIGPTPAYGITTQTQTTYKKDTATASVVSGLTPGTTYHVRLVAQNSQGTSLGIDLLFATPAGATSPIATPAPPIALPGDDGSDEPTGHDAGDAAPAPAPAAAPELGQSINVAPSTGSVLVRVPGTPRAVPITALTSIPVGALVDARRGTVQLKTQVAGGKTQTGTFHGGLFEVRQPKGTGGMTELVLRGPLPTCGAGGTRAAATTAKRPPRVLWGHDNHGKFRTRASNSVATVRGTVWYVADRCDGTLTRVRKGSVAVRDVHTGRTVVVRAGHSYLARSAR